MNKIRRYILEKSDFKTIKNNKVSLTSDERKLCFDRDAVWHYASSKDPTTGRTVKKVSAVWKGKDGEGKMVYATNTHRAASTASTLKGAIKKFHDFIKGTA